ncbi:MAG: M13 family metallopeptidase [Bacteroidota bacterium]|nr:M13 family metallopeptidase [Bacteroidota bacterium]
MNNKLIVPAMALAVLFTGFSGKKDPVKGINVNDLDVSTNPAKNFYEFANGGWLKNNPMPAEYSRYGAFDKLQENNDKMLRELVGQLAQKHGSQGSIDQKIGDFYTAGMDTLSIEKAGIAPLKPELEKIQKAKNFNDIQALIIHLHSLDIYPLFSFYGEADSKNSEMYIAQLAQGGLALGDRDYYTGTDARSREIQTEYVKHIGKMLGFAGYSVKQAETLASKIIAFETQLAKASKTRLELRDPEGNYHKMKLSDVQNLAPNYNWQGYFTGIGLANPGDINVGQPDFFKEVNNMAKNISIENWKAYLTWTLIDNTAAYLSSNFVNQNFEFYDKFMSGRKVIRPRWRRVLTTTNSILGEPIGQMFVEKYFPASSKQRMVKLVENLRFALGERIKQLDWMGNETKEKALEKLAAIRVKIGYPDKWRDYSGLTINKSSYLQNILNGRKFNFNYELNQINKPVDHNKWLMTPQTVNAYYNPNDNEICFPAGILQPPFFYTDADDAVNYGAIGVVIGHEITHGFDDQGAQYDKKGNLNQWWTSEDKKRFTERTETLAKQFDSFVVVDTVHANGHLTLGENIADLGGLNISFTALKKALQENPAPAKTDGFTPEQRFFIAYARVWGQHITSKEILRRTKEDVHSLGLFRVNGPLPNLPEFHKAFNVQPGDPMYLPAEKRAVIW